MMDCAPVAIFCYRRKIDKLIESILDNEESRKTELFIFSDGYRSEIDKEDVKEVRKSLEKIKGFRSVKIIESDKNKGLAKSIIDGVSQVIRKFGKIIVLEDDLIVSKYFLDYMNKSLNLYQVNKNIWSISGYGPKIPYLKNYKKDVYLSKRSSSWGWATWLNRWDKIDWEIKDFKILKKNKVEIKNFEQGGNDLFKMLELQHLGKIDSWAIRWCYAQFKSNSYSLTPKISMIHNTGFNDDFGTHNTGRGLKWKVDLAHYKIQDFNTTINNELFYHYKRFHDINFYTKTGYFLKKWGGYKLIKKILYKLKF